jgi:hypothetical protein
MKKQIILLLLLSVSAASYSQPINTSTSPVKADYLQKSKKQKTIAWVLAGAGAGLVVVSFATFSKEDFANTIFLQDARAANTSATLLIIGGITTLSSIPLFIAAGRNKRKGMSLSLKNETAPQLQNNSFVYKPIPSLTLKINL